MGANVLVEEGEAFLNLVRLELLALVRRFDRVNLTFSLERLEDLLHFESGFVRSLLGLVQNLWVLNVLLLFSLAFLVFVEFFNTWLI